MSGETFEALLTPNLRFVRTLVFTRVKTTGHAEDIIQETLLRAYTHRHQLREETKFKTWIWSIALNTIREHFRRERALASLDECPRLDIPDPAVSPLARVERMEACAWVRDSVAKLSERDQAAIRLRDIEEKSLPEVAAALRRSQSATKTAHFRARKRLAVLLKDSGRQVGAAVLQAAQKPSSLRRTPSMIAPAAFSNRISKLIVIW